MNKLILGRIDSDKKVLYARKADKRRAAFDSALKLSDAYDAHVKVDAMPQICIV